MKTYFVNWQVYRAYSVEVEVKDDEDGDDAIDKVRNDVDNAEINDWGFQGYVEDSFNAEEITDADCTEF